MHDDELSLLVMKHVRDIADVSPQQHDFVFHEFFRNVLDDCKKAMAFAPENQREAKEFAKDRTFLSERKAALNACKRLRSFLTMRERAHVAAAEAMRELREKGLSPAVPAPRNVDYFVGVLQALETSIANTNSRRGERQNGSEDIKQWAEYYGCIRINERNAWHRPPGKEFLLLFAVTFHVRSYRADTQTPMMGTIPDGDGTPWAAIARLVANIFPNQDKPLCGTQAYQLINNFLKAHPTAEYVGWE